MSSRSSTAARAPRDRQPRGPKSHGSPPPLSPRRPALLRHRRRDAAPAGERAPDRRTRHARVHPRRHPAPQLERGRRARIPLRGAGAGPRSPTQPVMVPTEATDAGGRPYFVKPLASDGFDPATPGFAIQKLLQRSDGSESMTLYVGTVEPGGAGPDTHIHPFDQFYYVLEGELSAEIGARPGHRPAARPRRAAGWRPAQAVERCSRDRATHNADRPGAAPRGGLGCRRRADTDRRHPHLMRPPAPSLGSAPMIGCQFVRP